MTINSHCCKLPGAWSSVTAALTNTSSAPGPSLAQPLSRQLSRPPVHPHESPHNQAPPQISEDLHSPDREVNIRGPLGTVLLADPPRMTSPVGKVLLPSVLESAERGGHTGSVLVGGCGPRGLVRKATQARTPRTACTSSVSRTGSAEGAGHQGTGCSRPLSKPRAG